MLNQEKNSDKLAVVVPFYYPNSTKTLENIEQFINGIDKLIIWDNTPSEEKVKYAINLDKYSEKIIYLTSGKNEGTAYAYNRAAEWVLMNNYDYLILMDQDSKWVNFNEYKNSAFTYIKAKPNSIFTPQINHVESDVEMEKVDNCISSGMFISKDVYQRIGKFEEKLFVECVDIDYCLRARALNIEILRIKNDSLIIQQFGQTNHSKLFNFYTRNDSPERTYNIAKNHLLIIRKYWKQLKRYEIKEWIWAYIIARFFKIILAEENKLKKSSSIIKACFDGLLSPIY